MKGLAFLKKVSLAANEVVKPVLARTTAAKDRNPTDADIRIYKNGAAYPSAALVAEFNLSFTAKDAADKGNAFDVFKSKSFPNTAALDENFLFITAVPRTQPKTDLFSSTGYDKVTNEPLADVLTQGAVTFGLELLAYAKEVYDIEPTEETPYIDLLIVRDSPFTTNDGIYFIPKVISRGEKKGQADIVRRENLTLYTLVPAAWAKEEEVEATAEESAGTSVAPDKAKVKAKETAEA